MTKEEVLKASDDEINIEDFDDVELDTVSVSIERLTELIRAEVMVDTLRALLGMKRQKEKIKDDANNCSR